MHSLTPTHSPPDQRLKFCLLSALSISILLFTVIHLKHLIPNHKPSFRPNCHTTNPYSSTKQDAHRTPLVDMNVVKGEKVGVKVDIINGPHGHYVDNVVFVWGKERVVTEKSHDGPSHNTVDDVAAWGFIKSDGEKAKLHEGHHTVDEVAAWGFVWEDKEVEKEKSRESPHRSSIADLDIWRLLTKHRNTGEKSHQSPHRYSIADLNIWKLLTKPSHQKDQQIPGKEEEKTQMHGNGGEVCDSFFVSDLVGCAKVVNGKFRGGKGRKKLANFGENWAAVEEAKEREEARRKEENVMRKEGLR